MKNIFNKANAPYIVSSTLAIATLLASGVFAVAPYVALLAPVVALGVGLPFVIGAAVFSSVVTALSFVGISNNKQLANQAKEIKGKNRDIFEKSKELTFTTSHLDAQNAKQKAEMQEQLDKKVKYIIQSDEDAKKVHQERKERNREEVLDSEALSNLFREEPKFDEVVKKVEDRTTRVVKSGGGIAACALAMAALVSRLLPVPTCTGTGLSGQQTSVNQTGNNSAVGSSFTQYVPTPQAVLENKANEYEQTLNNAFRSAKNNFGIPQGQSEPFFARIDNVMNTSRKQGTIVDSVKLNELTTALSVV